MNSGSRTTPEMRQAIYQRVLAGEKMAAISRDLQLSRQLVSQIVQRYTKAAAEGSIKPERQRRNLAHKYPDQIAALRLLVTTRTPAELSQHGFKGWNYRSLQKLTAALFKFHMMRPEAEALLREWGVESDSTWAAPDGTIPAGGDLKALPRRGFAGEPLPAAYGIYLASPTGQKVQEGIKAFIAREQEAMLASGFRGWPGKKLGRRFTVNPSPHPAPLEESSPISNPADVHRRLDAARALIGEAAVQRVINHYRKKTI